MSTNKTVAKATTNTTDKKVVDTSKLTKVRVDEREQEWLDAFKKAGYDVSIDKKHINLNIKGTGISIAIQKTNLVPYIRFSSTEQLEGLEKIFTVKKYGYEVAMPKKQSDKGDNRFRAVGKRTDDEIQIALELVQKVVELKAKTAPKKEEKKPVEKKAPAKTEKKAPAKKPAEKKPATRRTVKKEAAKND